MKSPLNLRIEKLVSGGEGLGFHEGKAVFVPYALPGELVSVEIAEEKRDFAAAALLEVKEPSPERVTPPCAVYGDCGGCNLQHLVYEAQLREKSAIVRETFTRIARFDPGELPIVPSLPFAYRNRLQFHLSDRRWLGFMRRNSQAVVEIATCPIALRPIQAWIEARANGDRAYEELKDYIVGKDRFIVFGAGDEVFVEGKWGVIEAPVAGEPIRFHIRGFFQSNLYLLDRLVPEVVEDLSGRAVADLYSGVGLFGRFLSRRFDRVVMVEQNQYALGLAKTNAPGAGNEYHALSVEDWCRGPGAAAEFDCVLVDPPRVGLSAEIRAWLTAKGPSRIVYVSCDPVTLARDAADLVAGGYRLEHLKIFDFYPQTGHAECHARFRRD